MRFATQRVLLTVLAGLVAFGGAGLALAVLPFHPLTIMIAASIAAAVVLAAHLARISGRIPALRTVSAVFPAICYLAAMFVCCFIGWGDPVEHLERGFLHGIHRVLPLGWVGGTIGVLTVFIPLLAAGLVWLSISIVTGVFRLRVLLGLNAGSLLLVCIGLTLACLFSLHEKLWVGGIIELLLAVFCGLVVALALLRLGSKRDRRQVLAFTVGTLLVFPIAGGVTLLMCPPEKRLPEAPPTRTVDHYTSGSVVDASKGWAIFSIVGELGNWTLLRDDRSNAADAPPPGTPFRVESEAKGRVETGIVFDDGAQRRLLDLYDCSRVYVYLYQLTEDRVLVTGCTKFSLFDARGNRVGSDDFVRPEVSLAALSRDGRRFVLLVYVWGIGDPPYVEEEEIVVYDTATARPLLAVNTDPKVYSLAAISPDGSDLAVETAQTLRLFRLPELEKRSSHN